MLEDGLPTLASTLQMREMPYPGFPMVTDCLLPPRRGFDAAGAVASSVVTFCFFARRAGGGLIVAVLMSGLRLGSSEAFRLRDLGWVWGWVAVDAEAGAEGFD